MSKKEILKEEVITDEAVVEEAIEESAEVAEESIAEVAEKATEPTEVAEAAPEEAATEAPELPKEAQEDAAKEGIIQQEETAEAATCDERAHADVSEAAVDTEIKFVENVIMYNAPDLNRAGFPYTGNIQVVGPQNDEFIAVNYVRSGFGVVRGFLRK